MFSLLGFVIINLHRFRMSKFFETRSPPMIAMSALGGVVAISRLVVVGFVSEICRRQMNGIEGNVGIVGSALLPV